MFTVGETARLHDMPVKTLRYYDEIDLFKPADVDPLTGYRYYRAEQFEILNSIKFLRDHGLPIARIKEHLERRDLPGFVEQLREQREFYRREMRRLREASRSLDERIGELSTLPGAGDFGRMKLVRKPERSVLMLRREFSDNDELELNLRELERRAGLRSSQIIGRVGLTVGKEDLERGRFDRFNGLFIVSTGKRRSALSERLPAGTYATVYINAEDHSRSAHYYPGLLDFIAEEGYGVAGDAVERVMSDSFITRDEGEYVTEIEIPVERVSD